MGMVLVLKVSEAKVIDLSRSPSGCVLQ